MFDVCDACFGFLIEGVGIPLFGRSRPFPCMQIVGYSNEICLSAHRVSILLISHDSCSALNTNSFRIDVIQWGS